MLPHLSAAYALARFLTRSEADAEDAVQDACLRALRHFDGFRGVDGRPWLLAIVRNVCYSLLERRGSREAPLEEDAPCCDSTPAIPPSCCSAAAS